MNRCNFDPMIPYSYEYPRVVYFFSIDSTYHRLIRQKFSRIALYLGKLIIIHSKGA